jgi:hypothetical protein
MEDGMADELRNDAPPMGANVVPTLMLGLGGVGGRLVEQIYGRIPPDERRRIATHVMDTDFGALAEAKYMTTADLRTQLGTNTSVGELRHYYPTSDSWMPIDRELDRRSTVLGAGQVRAVGRLALMHLLDAKGVRGLRAAINGLKVQAGQHGDLKEIEPRVWVFCSLAGGTGAGTFISVALLVRSLMREMIGEARGFLVNGVFVLPDVLTQTRSEISQSLWTFMRANAQAAMRELYAITASGKGYGDPLELEFRERSGAAAVLEDPFEYSFLFDYRSMNNTALADYDAYIEQVARSMHLLLFSPMAHQSRSNLDNLVRGEIDAHGFAKFAAPATASMVFPREDLLDYLGARWASEQLSDQWLIIDRDFEAARKRHRDDLKKHIVRAEPDRASMFIDDVNRRSRDKTRNSPFFQGIVVQAHHDPTPHGVGSSRAESWIDAVGLEVDRRVASRIPLIDPPNRDHLRSAGAVASEIGNSETKLQTMRRSLGKIIDGVVDSLAPEILQRDADDDNITKGAGAHRLNHWVFEGDHVVHPLAVRYILYAAKQNLKRELEALSSETASGRNLVRSHESGEFDDARTPDVVEDVSGRINAALRAGVIAGLTRRATIERLAVDYQERFQEHYGAATEYLKNAAREGVLRKLLEEVEAFIEAWELFFGLLEDVRTRLSTTAERLYGIHRQSEGRATQFILASERDKDALWARLQESTGDATSTDVATTTYRLLFEQHGSRNQERGRSRPSSGGLSLAFQEALLGAVRSVVERLDILPHGIAEALAREAELAGVGRVEHAKKRLGQLQGLAVPFVQVRQNPDVNLADAYYWGLHPTEHTYLGHEVTVDFGINHAFVDPAYDRDELLFIKIPFLVKARDLYMFTPGVAALRQPDGRYFEAFVQHVEAVQGGQITAHLDKRWDWTLPDFWDNEYLVNRVLVHGLARGLISEAGGTWNVELRKGKGFEPVPLAPARRGDLRYLQDALERHPRFDECLTRVTELMTAEDVGMPEKALHLHPFIKGIRPSKPKKGDPNGGDAAAKGLFVLVIESYLGAANEAKDRRALRTQALFRALCEEVRRYVAGVIGDPTDAARRTRDILKGGLAAAKARLSESKTHKIPPELLRHLDDIVRGYRV